MNAKRAYLGLLGLIGLLFVALIAGAYGANNMLSARAGTLTGLKAKSQALQQEQQSFVIAKENVKKYADLEQIAKTVVPQDKSQAEAVREIVNVAAANNIALGSITFPASTLGNVSGSSSSSSSSSAHGSSSTATPPPAPSANSPATKLSQLTAVPGIPGVYQLTITISGNTKAPVKYDQLINFLSGLEHDRHTAQVNSLAIQPAADNLKALNFTITVNEYIKP